MFSHANVNTHLVPSIEVKTASGSSLFNSKEEVNGSKKAFVIGIKFTSMEEANKFTSIEEVKYKNDMKYVIW